MENHGCLKQQQWAEVHSSENRQPMLTLEEHWHLIKKGEKGDRMSSGPYTSTKLKQRNELLLMEFYNRDRTKTSLLGNIWGLDLPVRYSFTPSKVLSDPDLQIYATKIPDVLFFFLLVISVKFSSMFIKL